MAKLLLIHALFSLFSAVRVDVVILAFTPSPQSYYSPIRRQQQRAIVTPPQTTVVAATAGLLSSFSCRCRDYHHRHPYRIVVNDQALYAASSSENDDAAADSPSLVGNSSSRNGSSMLADIAGILASVIVLISEFTLKTTGCGLPAGPFGLVGAVEGISYLTVVGIAAYSIYYSNVIIINDNNKLNAGGIGSIGILSVLVQGLAFLSIIVGLVVLAFQITDYGYIPNAVPMPGGMCQ
jgi:hypothetical protein